MEKVPGFVISSSEDEEEENVALPDSRFVLSDSEDHVFSEIQCGSGSLSSVVEVQVEDKVHVDKSDVPIACTYPPVFAVQVEDKVHVNESDVGVKLFNCGKESVDLKGKKSVYDRRMSDCEDHFFSDS